MRVVGGAVQFAPRPHGASRAQSNKGKGGEKPSHGFFQCSTGFRYPHHRRGELFMTRFRWIVGLLLILVATAQALPERTQTFQIQPVASPAGALSAQPQLTVSRRGVLLSWVERQGAAATLKFSERTAAGWSTPTTVSSGNNWFVNWADVPSVLRLSDGRLIGHWLQKSDPSTYAYDVRLAQSSDDGRTWSKSFTPHHDGTKTEHGFASIFEMPGNNVGMIWLDGRGMMPGDHDAAGDHGAMSVRYASFDRSWKQTAELLIDDRVCECCPTTAVVTADGPLAAFRDRGDAELRNIHVSRLDKGRWTVSQPVHDDGWKINACPVNGPALSANGKQVVAAWFTGGSNSNRAFVAFSFDAGRTFGTPVRLDDETTLGRVDVQLLADGSAVGAWLEPVGDGRAEFRIRRIDRSGQRSAAQSVTQVRSSRASGYPRMALSGDELIFAWVADAPGGSTGSTVVATARATVKR